MQKKDSMTRRDFLGKTATVAAGVSAFALASPRAVGANERIRVGMVGPGGRGRYLMDRVNQIDNAEFVAVADIFEGWKNLGLEIARKKNPAAKGYDLLEKMLDDKDVDVVVAATPEHTHVDHIITTIKSGRDIYCEKPMNHTWEEGIKIIEANKKAKRIIQIGTQRRSVDIYYQARELVQSGAIGKVTAVRGRWHRNSKDNDPQWRYGIPADANEKNINWPVFLGKAPKVPFDLNRYFQWRCYWDYSNGPAGDLMVHQLDAINIVMGGQMPKSAMGLGDIYRFHELGRTTPDTWSSILEFPGGNPWAPDGYLVQYSCVFSNQADQYGEIFYGTDGTIDMNDRVLRLIPEPEGVAMKKVEAKEFQTQIPDHGKAHLENFFDCCRTRKQPNCDEYQGHYAASAAHMAVLCHFSGERTLWDDKKQKVE